LHFWLGWRAQSASILSTALNLILFMYSLLGLQVDGDTRIGRLQGFGAIETNRRPMLHAPRPEKVWFYPTHSYALG